MKINKEWKAIKSAMEASKGMVGEENEQWWKELKVFPAILKVYPWDAIKACEFFGVENDTVNRQVLGLAVFFLTGREYSVLGKERLNLIPVNPSPILP